MLVIGRGPSGQDISLELSRISKREVIVSSREYDEDVALGKAIPTSPEDKRTLKPSIDHIAVDGSVVFVDGSTLPAPDVLMYATGYLYSVSDFLPSDLLYPKAPQASAIATLEGELHDELKQAAEEKHLLAPIYKQVFAIENPDVAFIGLPFSNLPFLCFELQSRWIARVFHDASLLPSKQEMYDTYRAQLETLPWPVDSLHKLGPTQPDYFAYVSCLLVDCSMIRLTDTVLTDAARSLPSRMPKWTRWSSRCSPMRVICDYTTHLTTASPSSLWTKARASGRAS